jgi:hypothetical protein
MSLTSQGRRDLQDERDSGTNPENLVNPVKTNSGYIRTNYSRNRTGCVGISIVRSASGRRDGTVLTYFSAHARLTSGQRGRRVNRKFCIETLGRHEAWRRALKFRADHELKTRQDLQDSQDSNQRNPVNPVHYSGRAS